MRKDAKIGFAIGGVLLAVLTVYAIVVPKHNRAGTNKTVSLVAPPGAQTTDTPPVAPAASAGDSSKPAITDKSDDTKPDAVARTDDTRSADGVNWAKLLSGSAEAPTLMTTTPAPGDARTSADAPTADATQPKAVKTTGDTTAATDTTPSDPPVTLSASTAVHPITEVATGAATQPAQTAGRSYTIKQGQTLSSIAAEVYGNQRFYVAILRANPSINPARLRPGSKITLPDVSDVKPEASLAVEKVDKQSSDKPAASPAAGSGRTYKVESGDNLYRIARKLFGTPKLADAIYDLNKQSIGPDKAHLKLGMILTLPQAPNAGATASSN